MNREQKLEKARKLLIEVNIEDRNNLEKEKEERGNDMCKCGHERKYHSKSFSINWTQGFCEKCKCCNFSMK
jgi:hypothetical protein